MSSVPLGLLPHDVNNVEGSHDVGRPRKEAMFPPEACTQTHDICQKSRAEDEDNDKQGRTPVCQLPACRMERKLLKGRGCGIGEGEEGDVGPCSSSGRFTCSRNWDYGQNRERLGVSMVKLDLKGGRRDCLSIPQMRANNLQFEITMNLGGREQTGTI